MKLFSVATVVLTSTLLRFAPVSGVCTGIQNPDIVTEIDFGSSVIVNNTLHEGGEIRYQNVGLSSNTELDLVVTVAYGDYADIAQVWHDRGKTNATRPSLNGKNGEFGNINLQTVKTLPKSGEGNFRFCLMETGTYNRVAQNFTFTIYDLDERGDDEIVNANEWRISIKEKLLIQTNQAMFYQLDDNTEIEVLCEDLESPPCSGRTVFHSSSRGLVGGDNPTDPDTLTVLQKSRSVAFIFQDRDCWELSYDHYCPVEQSDFTCEVQNCGNLCRGKYTGGNFLFSGKSPKFVNNGTCTTPSPTISPSVAPSIEPSELPTIEPTIEPSNKPSSDPSAFPTIAPTAKPSNKPSSDPSAFPTVAPTVEPSDQPSSDPSAPPSFPPPECPADVYLFATIGSTPVDLGQAVRIISRSASTVTVRLYNAWTSANDAIDSIVYQYKKSSFVQECIVEDGVMGGDAYRDLTLQCYHTRSYAQLDIFVADNGGTLNSTSDDASVPDCCNANLPANTPVVKYTIVVKCQSVCDDSSASPSASPIASLGSSPGISGFQCTRKYIEENGMANGCNSANPPIQCQIIGGCGDGILPGYYPDLTNKDSYCFCTGSVAPARYETCQHGLKWDSFTPYVAGSVDGVTLGMFGYWGTAGGTCNYETSVSDATKLRPPY